MKLTFGLAVALVASAVFAGSAVAQSANTMRLGIGSVTAGNAANAAPVVSTLKHTADTTADTENVFIRPYARGYYHGSSGFAYRPWVGSYYRPWVGFYRPFVTPYYYGLYRPLLFPRPYLYGAAYSYTYPVADAGFAVTTGVANSYPSIPYYNAIPQDYGPLPGMLTGGSETLPIPRPIDTFRYDGGPLVPVPLPDGSRPLPANRPSVPAGAAVVNRVAATPVKKIAYPAYGEQLPTPPRPATGGPVLVKYPGQK